MATHFNTLAGKLPGQRSLASPWGHKESDMTEHTHTHTLPSRYPHVPACPSFISFLKGNRGPKRLS